MRSSSLSTAVLLGAIASTCSADSEPQSFVSTGISGPFVEQFNDSWDQRWSASSAVKQTPVGGETFSYVGVWSVEEPTVLPGIPGDKGLVIKSKAAHHAISAEIQPAVAIEEGKPLVVQYETKLQKGLECGGAYLKLLSEGEGDLSAAEFSDKTPFTIMFGPDKCGSTNKVHFIFRHKNPKTGEYEEKHLTSAPAPKIAKTTTLYTLIVNPDNTFDILINDSSVKSGSLLEDFTPAVNPDAEIDDKADFKPTTWVDEAKISDPEAFKPEEWDENAPMTIIDTEATIPEGWLVNESEVIPDPDAEKPEEWDDEEDGDWLAPSVPNPVCEEAPGCGPWSQPSISNPAYKGKWSAPLIDNPEYKGVWAPRKIANPDFFEDLEPAKGLTAIGGVGFEIWTMTEDMLFDNIYIGHSVEDAKAFAAETYHVKAAIEKSAESAADAADEAEAEKALGGKSSPSSVSEYLDFAKEQTLTFKNAFLEDPLAAVKAYPTALAALVATLLTSLGTLSLLLSLLGGSSSPSPKAKSSASSKKTEKAPVPVLGPAVVVVESKAETTAVERPVVVEGVSTRKSAAAAPKKDL